MGEYGLENSWKAEQIAVRHEAIMNAARALPSQLQYRQISLNWKLSLLLHWLVPFLPRRTTLKLSRRTMEKY